MEQGSILQVDGLRFPVVVVSKAYFNREGKVLVCPLMKDTPAGPLHIAVSIGGSEGTVWCEQVRYLDLTARHWTLKGVLPYFTLMDISDAIQGIIEY